MQLRYPCDLPRTGFDCSNFQYQLKEQEKPFDEHIFQVRSPSSASLDFSPTRRADHLPQ
jgi:hypothetical protein